MYYPMRLTAPSAPLFRGNEDSETPGAPRRGATPARPEEGSTMARPRKLPASTLESLARIKLYLDRPDDDESRGYARADMKAFCRKPEAARAKARVKAEWLEFPKTCPRPSCRRHGRCATPLVLCQFERVFEFESWGDEEEAP